MVAGMARNAFGGARQMYIIRYRRIGTSEHGSHGRFSFAADAERIAVRLNCKPFTPFFFWVERED